MASSSSTPAQESNTQLLFVGKQCSNPTCLIVDFLPFKCQHCEQSFCQEHFKVDAHKCPSYDESKHNRIAPNCPLCHTPVAVRQGQDPNERMDLHLEKECIVVTGKVQSKSTPLCARSTCKKVLFSPIRCDKCRQQFCPAHRFPGDHTCAPVQVAPKYAPNLLDKFEAGAKNLSTKASAAAKTSNLATIKMPTFNTASAPKPAAASKPVASGSTSASTSKPKLPFNKMDRRARAERESKLKAMKARAQKGLLSEEEKVVLAEEEALAANKKDCVIM